MDMCAAGDHITIVVQWPTAAPIADPNEHYRPWIEANVGRQSVDWDWGLINNDARDNTLSIWFDKRHEMLAMTAKLMWA